LIIIALYCIISALQDCEHLPHCIHAFLNPMPRSCDWQGLFQWK